MAQDPKDNDLKLISTLAPKIKPSSSSGDAGRSKYQFRTPTPGHPYCVVCKHRRRKSIEEMYLDWYTTEQIELRYQIPKDLIEAHGQAFGIDKDRSEDTSRYYRAVIREAGPTFLLKAGTISEKFMMAILQQLDRVEGREQKARRNEADVRREEQYIQETLQRLQKDLGLTREQALKVIKDEMPELAEYLN